LALSEPTSKGRGFVVMPFGKKKNGKGEEVDFDLVFRELIAPAMQAAGIEPFRADSERRAGSIHSDMFQELLIADVVLADLSIDNANAYYELGVRHALRDNATVSIFCADRGWLPFDVIGERSLVYRPVSEPLDHGTLQQDRQKLTGMINATLAAWRGRKTSPVYRMLPNLEEPQWKRLKVGDINEFWQRLDSWQSWVTTALYKQRPGDILLLADETPNRILELEALVTAAKALLQLNSAKYALATIERGLTLDPDHLWLRQQQGIALGRLGRFADARMRLGRLAAQNRSGETLGLLGRCYKDHWVQLWCKKGAAANEHASKAVAAAAHLDRAVGVYVKASRAEPADFYPGINALTLGRLWEHLTGKKSPHDLELLTHGLRWAVDCALRRADSEDTGYWERVTRGELRLVADNDPNCIEDYEIAAARAVVDSNRFALSSTDEQLQILEQLGFHSELVRRVRQVLATAEGQLAELLGPRRRKPKHVVLFSGHMVDSPERTSAGGQPRLPAGKVDAARLAIEQALDRIGAGEGDLGLCGGACGGDLLFAEAALARGMHLDVRIARRIPQFMEKSVTFADPEQRWAKSFEAATSHPLTSVLVMPDEVGPTPEGVNVYDRCNRWQIYSALSQDLNNVQFVTLWDGQPGKDGGTQETVNSIREVTGRKPIIIDPLKL
jgi:hypothetical protein